MYNNLEKISSVIFKPAQNLSLKHVVKIANKRPDGKRELFHSEYSYSSPSTYTNCKTLSSIKLQFNSYLLLEEDDKTKPWALKENILLNYTTIYRFEKFLKKVITWFYKYDDLYFYTGKNNLNLNKEITKNLKETVYMSSKYIVAIPTVIVKNDIEFEGILMYINSTTTCIHLTIDRLEALYCVISKFNLYEAGLSMINYVGRPEFGKFHTDLSTAHDDRPASEKYEDKNKLSKGIKNKTQLGYEHYFEED